MHVTGYDDNHDDVVDFDLNTHWVHENVNISRPENLFCS